MPKRRKLTPYQRDKKLVAKLERKRSRTPSESALLGHARKRVAKQAAIYSKRAKKAAKAKAEQAEREKRSAAAKKGWETRRENEAREIAQAESMARELAETGPLPLLMEVPGEETLGEIAAEWAEDPSEIATSLGWFTEYLEGFDTPTVGPHVVYALCLVVRTSRERSRRGYDDRAIVWVAINVGIFAADPTLSDRASASAKLDLHNLGDSIKVKLGLLRSIRAVE